MSTDTADLDTVSEVSVDTIATSDVWSAYLDRIAALTEEARIHVDENGFRTTAIDPANVAMVDVGLGNEAFESFRVATGSTTIGVNISRLQDAIGLADAGELAAVVYNPDRRTLHVQAGGLEYTLATIDPDSIREEPDMPTLDLPAYPVLEAEQLEYAVRAADLCSDHIALGFDMDEHHAYAEASGDTDDVRVEWDRDDLQDGSTADDAARSLFSLDYMKDVVGVLETGDGAENVDVHLGDEFPVKFEQSYADGAGHVEFGIAPRIDSGGGR